MSIFLRDFSVSCEIFSENISETCNEIRDLNVVLIHVHRDELDAQECGVICSNEYDINFIYFSDCNKKNKELLDSTITREINFFNKKNISEVYSVDPNRIWTDNGIAQEILNLGVTDDNISCVLRKEISVLTHYIKNLLFGFNTIIALHNNTGDDFSILYYIENILEDSNVQKYQYKCGVSDIFIYDKKNISDFFITTSVSIFQKLKNANKFNCVLLQRSENKMDGSLSSYALSIGKDYINIEVLRGRVEVQLEMLRLLLDNILKS